MTAAPALCSARSGRARGCRRSAISPTRTLEDALAVQCAGLIAGEVDAILIETCQDPLQIKAAVNGAKRARDEAGKDIPILVQVTVETTGTLLVGADIAAAATIIHALDVPVIGLNCATGPREMAEHVKWLGENWPGHISVQPNAGLPELVDGQHALPADARASWRSGSSALCSRTGSTSSAAAAAPKPRISPRSTRCCAASAGDRPRPAPQARAAVPGCRRSPRSTARCRCARRTPICRSASAATPTARAPSAGCRRQGDWDGCVEMGREQVKEGSHTLDVCTAFVGRDEIAEMTEVVSRMRGAINAPLGHRLDRIPGARSRAQALWRQADHQLDQFRGRRGGRPTSG